MVTEPEFRAAFSDEGLRTFEAAAARTLGLPAEESNWLTTVGLPESAPPFFSFGQDAERGLRTVREFLHGARDLPADAERYRVIGSNGIGDPVAIDVAEKGAVVYLNHDNRFERVLINSSIRQLATSLAAFAKMIAAAQAANGEDAYIDGNVPAAVVDTLRDEIRRVDAVALEPGTMWADEIASLGAGGREEAKLPWWRRLFGGAG
jgi:hypothetical protein